MFQEKPDFSTSDLYDRIRHQFMIEQNRYRQSWEHFDPRKLLCLGWGSISKIFDSRQIEPSNRDMNFGQYNLTIFNKIFLSCLKLTFWNLTQLSNVFLPEFKDTIQGKWIIRVPVARDRSFRYTTGGTLL